MTSNSLTSQYFWPFSFGKFLRRLHLASLYKPVGVILLIAFLYHHLNRTVENKRRHFEKLVFHFLKCVVIFLSDPLSLRDLDEQFLDF